LRWWSRSGGFGSALKGTKMAAILYFVCGRRLHT
jgi:hypothetical protein